MSENVLTCPLVPNTVKVPDVDYGTFLFDGLKKNSSNLVLKNSSTKESLTGLEFVRTAEYIARQLLHAGCRKGDVLAVFSPNSLDWVLVLAASLRIGVTVAGINSLLTSGEVQHQLKVCRAKCIFTTKTLITTVEEAMRSRNIQINVFLSEYHTGCTHLSTKLTAVAAGNLPTLPTLRELNIKPQGVALIMFSSGTTGPQKGVMLSHRNLVYEALMFKHPQLDLLASNMVVFAPIAHMSGMAGVIFGLALGSRIVVMSRFDFSDYLQNLVDEKITKIGIVPPIATLLAKSPEVDKYGVLLKEIVCGAAPLSRDIEDLLIQRFPGLIVRQIYGMTEVTLVSHCIPLLGPHSTQKRKPGSVGCPVVNVAIKVIDLDTGDALGPHRSGEILIKGVPVMLGYANNSEATAATIDNDGWLHSGDVGYFDEDGYFYIVDRIKELIKYNAYQVAPAELEAVLLSHSQVADAGVTGIPDPASGEVPLAWVVRKPGSIITEKELQVYVAGKVAPYKALRGGVRFVPAIPKNATGKILRSAMKMAGLHGHI